MISCPLKTLKAWKDLEAIYGENKAIGLWVKYDGYPPDYLYTPKVIEAIPLNKETEPIYKKYNLINNKGEIKTFLSLKTANKFAASLNQSPNYSFYVKNTPKGIRVLLYPKKVVEQKKEEEPVNRNGIQGTLFQNQTQSSEGKNAPENTIRDLAARIADRIGLPFKFESDRTKMYKGKIENGVAYINLAYATLDTAVHEILGHPIIRAIKKQGIGGTITLKGLDESTKKDSILYQNLLKELETGRGKEVLDRIKRDYAYKNQNDSFKLINSELIESGRFKGLPKEFSINGFDLKYDEKSNDLIDLSLNIAAVPSQVKSIIDENTKRYTLEEQQEEAIVELLGLMTAEKLDNVKDGKLISLLKRLLKEMKVFMKQLLGQREVEIDKLPDNMTLNDLSDLLAYSNSKLILPGNEVIYTTPDNQQFKTYQEASNHISELAKNIKDVDLDKNISVDNIDKEIETLQKELDNFKFEIEPFNKFTDVYTKKGRLRQNYLARKKDGTTGWTGGSKETLIEPEYDGFVLDIDRGDGRFITKISDKEAEELYYAEENKFNTTTKASREKYAELETKIHNLKNNSLKGFIEKNKEYEQSKEIIEEWKKINNIQYNPEEIYSRGQEFSSVVGAYSSFDVNLMMQNLLQHIEDNEKAGGQFAISAYTKPIDKQIGHLEGGGGKIKFNIYPQSNDILWAANTDVYSGSVWDASKKVNKDKKSELLGVSYTKFPALRNINSVQPNLASVVDDLAHHHNELGIVLTGNNFRLEYDEDIPYTTKKIIDSINSILDQKYGKLVKPKISKINTIPDTFEYWQQDMNEDGGVDRFRIQVYKKNNKWFEEFFDTNGQSESVREITYTEVENQFNEALASNSTLTRNKGIQPTQTNETLKESIDSVKNKILPSNQTRVNNELSEAYVKYNEETKLYEAWDKIIGFLGDTFKTKEEAEEFTGTNSNNKEYTSQALINTKIAKLKEVAKKYPRSLIRSEVKPINNYDNYVKVAGSEGLFDPDELPFQKRPSEEEPAKKKEPAKKIGKIEQYFQTRIAKLTKDYSLAKKDSQKEAIEKELELTKQKYAKSKEKGLKREAEYEFGKHSLELVEQRIDFLLKDKGQNFSSNLEYVNDVLDIWYGIPDLTDEVIRIREKTQGLKDDYLLENVHDNTTAKVKPTLEQIKEQTEDIGTFREWTGSLIDVANYIASTIGNIIKTSQTKIEKQSNAIFRDIESKIKEVSKTKDINEIYKEIIFLNEDSDTKTLIPLSQLNKVSPEAQEFYKFYQAKLEELMKITPTLMRRNENGELETFVLNKYFIPNVYIAETLKEKLLRQKKTLFGIIKERKLGDTVKDENLKADIIDLEYIKKIPSSVKSDDLGHSLFMFAKSMYHYNEMSDILPKVRLLQRSIFDTEYVQGSNPNSTKTGKDSKMWNMVEGFIKAQVKGETKKDEGRKGLYKKKGVDGEEVEVYLDATGSIDSLLRWNSLLRIGLSPITALANVSFGKISNFFEGFAGQFYTRKELTDKEQSESLKTSEKDSIDRLAELMYSPQKWGEKYIQSSTFLAIMHKEGYINSDGELTDSYNALSDKLKQQLFNKVQRVNHMLHGRYSPQESGTGQQKVIYRAASQFRKWMPSAIENRFDAKHYDERLQADIEGRYRSFARNFLKELFVKGDVKSAFYNLVMPLLNAEEALASGKLTASEIYNMRKMLIETISFLVISLLYAAGTGDDDKDKELRKNPLFKTTMLTLNRISGDIAFFYSPTQINNLGANAFPVQKLTKDLINISLEVPRFFTDKSEFTSGVNKGKERLPIKVLGLIPGSRPVTDFTKIFSKFELDEIK